MQYPKGAAAVAGGSALVRGQSMMELSGTGCDGLMAASHRNHPNVLPTQGCQNLTTKAQHKLEGSMSGCILPVSPQNQDWEIRDVMLWCWEIASPRQVAISSLSFTCDMM